MLCSTRGLTGPVNRLLLCRAGTRLTCSHRIYTHGAGLAWGSPRSPLTVPNGARHAVMKSPGKRMDRALLRWHTDTHCSPTSRHTVTALRGYIISYRWSSATTHSWHFFPIMQRERRFNSWTFICWLPLTLIKLTFWNVHIRQAQVYLLTWWRFIKASSFLDHRRSLMGPGGNVNQRVRFPFAFSTMKRKYSVKIKVYLTFSFNIIEEYYYFSIHCTLPSIVCNATPWQSLDPHLCLD